MFETALKERDKKMIEQGASRKAIETVKKMLERGETKPETMEINKQEILMEIKSMFEEKLKERDKEMTEKGIKIGTLRIAGKMKDLCYSIEEIAKITALSTREIEKL